MWYETPCGECGRVVRFLPVDIPEDDTEPVRVLCAACGRLSESTLWTPVEPGEVEV